MGLVDQPGPAAAAAAGAAEVGAVGRGPRGNQVVQSSKRLLRPHTGLPYVPKREKNMTAY